jgi:hypothetical protein
MRAVEIRTISLHKGKKTPTSEVTGPDVRDRKVPQWLNDDNRTVDAKKANGPK